MTDAELDARLATACGLARKAGCFASGKFADLGSLTVHSKGVQDMATEADVETEALLRKGLAELYPGDAFLGEESCSEFRSQAGRGVWVVDPIDGTQPFISNITSWCIALAYVRDSQTLLGVVYDPVRDELFAARRGGGASINNRPLRVSPAASLADGLVGLGYSNRVAPAATVGPLSRLLEEQGMFHRCGSGALSLAYVAAGRLIGYYEPHMNAWDAVAGGLLVREAGGRSNPALEREGVLEHGCAVLAAGAGVYQALLEVVSGGETVTGLT
ncbi:inositol monophosphatase family protein [Parahaliea mediterranea]|uniref:inositol monophosphatase family protein n=1 Tax=Parahaliea mediterranea TaxID=651086 RepID=UPI00130087E9|nr:inositol monophosphatase [Parahaliea mediterranea]